MFSYARPAADFTIGSSFFFSFDRPDVVMKILTLLTAAGLLLCSAGCQSHGDMDLLLRDLRLQEDQLWALKDQLVQTNAQLESCRRAYDAVQRGGSPNDVENNLPAPSAQPPNGGGIESLDPPADDLTTQDEFEIDLGEPVPSAPGTDIPLFNEGAASEGQQDGTSISRITLNELLTGGYDFDSVDGDEGILVVIEPEDQHGQPIVADGSVSIAVLDPDQTGHQARLARWDFRPDEASAHFRRTAFGTGLHFELPWPNRPPNNPSLRLVVRYRTLDGRTLYAQREMRINLPGKKSLGESNSSPQLAAQQGEDPDAFVPTPPEVLESSWQPKKSAVAESAPDIDRHEANGNRIAEPARLSSPVTSSAKRAIAARQRPRWTPYR